MNPIFFLLFTLFVLGTAAQPVVSIKKDTVGTSTVTYHTTCFGKTDSSIVFINVHENENTSVKAAKEILAAAKRYCLVQLKFRHIRFISFTHKGKHFTVDPNRIFTSKGAAASLKKNSGGCSEAIFAGALKAVNRLGGNYTDSFITHKNLVVALHNNTDGEPLSIISYKSGSEAQNAKDVHMNLQQDPDDFFFTTEKSIFNFLKQKGFNVALQDNENVLDDGSLSVYAGKNNIPYINIEAQENHVAEQKKMIEAVLEFIAIKHL
ncbi:MAG: hypothetical protein V4722_10955 [Bacteroidota bacterium]